MYIKILLRLFSCYAISCKSVKLQIGFEMGLFAIFGIIPYRTNDIPIKEMTYIFLIIRITVINALSNSKTNVTGLLFINLEAEYFFINEYRPTRPEIHIVANNYKINFEFAPKSDFTP